MAPSIFIQINNRNTVPVYPGFSTVYHNDVILTYLIIILLRGNKIDESTLEEFFLKDLVYINVIGESIFGGIGMYLIWQRHQEPHECFLPEMNRPSINIVIEFVTFLN